MSTRGYNQLPFDERVQALERLVHALPPPKCTPQHLSELVDHARAIPDKFFPKTFPQLLSNKFNVSLDKVKIALFGAERGEPLEDFDELVPKTGWFAEYIDYTRQTEPPTVFHFFAGASVVGATMQRRVYFPKGSGDVFPNLSCVLVAPSGKCRKTTACNTAVKLFRRIGGNVLANKITPEAIVETLVQSGSATGLLYAPEWAVFLGKQRYMEGLVPMLTDLFDCPETWSSGTLMRGTAQLNDVAISHLAATTIDWMQTSISEDTFSGGFMSRLLFIVQRDSPRSFALPPPLDEGKAKNLLAGLLALQHTTGPASLSPEAQVWYEKWYTERALSTTERQFAGYFERKPDRVLQLSMILNAAQHPRNLVIDVSTVKHAERILNWIERLMPQAFEELSQSNVGADQVRLLGQLRKNKGELDYSTWMRLNTRKLDTGTFKRYVDTLIAAKMVAADPTNPSRYFLLPAGKAVE